MRVKDAALVMDENDEFVAIVLLKLTTPALQGLTVKQLMGKGFVVVDWIGSMAKRVQRRGGEMVNQARQGPRIG